MESATFTSDIIKKFNELAPALERKHSITLQLAKISGKRWAYIAGRSIGDVPSLPPERIELGNGFGLIVYNGDKLSEIEKQQISENLKLKVKRSVLSFPMKDQIINYRQMCDVEEVQTLQRGMNFRLNPNYSIILMSQRHNAPYKDKVYSDGITIEYEGHDIPKTEGISNPKQYNQQRYTKNNKLTQNGRFSEAVDKYKEVKGEPEIVRVYEKLHAGVWSEKGFFKLIDYLYQDDGTGRSVFKFILEETDVTFDHEKIVEAKLKLRTRIIPSEVKREVWARDGGKCVICGAEDELHFDHDLPYSKGGTSITAENVRILCARHNLKNEIRQNRIRT